MRKRYHLPSPQGTILGLLLCLIKINDTTNFVLSTVKLYVDDTKIYRQLSTLLRILSLYKWIFPTLWNWHASGSYDLMRTRCKSMRITHTREKSFSQYLLDKPLKDVKNFKDLGVTISKDLSWDNHISITVNKANNLLGLVKRFVGTTNVNVFSTLYLSLVQPILEYAVPV